MITKDELIMSLYQNIDFDRIVEAKRNGTLISYLSEVADKILNIPVSVRTREVNQTGLRQAYTEDANETRRDSVRVSNL